MDSQAKLQGPTPPGNIQNRQPRIDDSSAANGRHTSPTSGPESTGQNFGDGEAWVDDNTGTKKPRPVRACDTCRTKKIKCDGKVPACSHCSRYNRECITSHVERKKRVAPKGARYIEILEKRLSRMESLLMKSGLVSDGIQDKAVQQLSLDQKASATNSPEQWLDSGVPTSQTNSYSSPLLHTPRDVSPANPASTKTSPGATEESEVNGQTANEESIELLSEHMGSLMTNSLGESKYIGLSSGFAIFSPKGVQWVDERSGGSSSLQEIIDTVSHDDVFLNEKESIESFNELFQRPIYEQLPTRTECHAVVEFFFDNFNCIMPLFHKPTFVYLVDRQYSSHPLDASGWWACLNVVLAMSHRMQVSGGLNSAENDRKAWGYLKNAIGVLSELIVQNTDLFGVQALLGIAIFMHATSNPQPAISLVAAAIRSSHSIGLHQHGSAINLNPTEIEQRKRVFWIAYQLDKDLSLRSGRPPAQDDDDMTVELPSLQPEDNVGTVLLGDCQINLFRLVSEFSVIQSNVYKQLYSTTAAKQPPEKLLNAVATLDKQLKEWKEKFPPGYRPDGLSHTLPGSSILNCMMLHFGYYNCLATIHRMSRYWATRVSDLTLQDLNTREVNPNFFASSAVSTSAARSSIQLLKFIPQEDTLAAWLIIHYVVSSLITIVSNILQSPHDPDARGDLGLLDLVINFLLALDTKERKQSIKQILTICLEFQRIAKTVLERSEKRMSFRKPINSQGDYYLKPQNPTNPVAKPIPSLDLSQASTSFAPAVPNNMSEQFPHGGAEPSDGVQGEHNYIPNFDSGNIPHNYTIPAENGLYHFDGMQHMQQMQHVVSNGEFGPPVNFNSYQQAFIPQDLWNMPMSMDWDWMDTADDDNIGNFDGNMLNVGRGV